MAKIKLGSLVADIRNKLDGIVFSKNTFGRYVRIKVTPVNPKTERQTEVRGKLEYLSKRYSTGLTEEQRALWRYFAQVGINPRYDAFGDLVSLTGISAYQSLNLVLLNSGDPIIDTPPINLEVGRIATATLEIGQNFSTATISFTPTPVGTTERVYIYATPPLSQGTNFFKNHLRFLTASQKGASSPVDIKEAYIGKYGTPPVGSKIAVLVTRENTTNGAVSKGLITSAIVP